MDVARAEPEPAELVAQAHVRGRMREAWLVERHRSRRCRRLVVLSAGHQVELRCEREIVDAHGGVIVAATPESGEGVAFLVELPA